MCGYQRSRSPPRPMRAHVSVRTSLARVWTSRSVLPGRTSAIAARGDRLVGHARRAAFASERFEPAGEPEAGVARAGLGAEPGVRVRGESRRGAHAVDLGGVLLRAEDADRAVRVVDRSERARRA